MRCWSKGAKLITMFINAVAAVAAKTLLRLIISVKLSLELALSICETQSKLDWDYPLAGCWWVLPHEKRVVCRVICLVKSQKYIVLLVVVNIAFLNAFTHAHVGCTSSPLSTLNFESGSPWCLVEAWQDQVDCHRYEKVSACHRKWRGGLDF
jgi:hypothetical protein